MAKLRAKKQPRRRAPKKARAGPSGTRRTRAIEAALAGIAHDIRTPLTGIVALAELLASSDLGTREREWANAIKSGADHLAALSTLIVDAAKADATGLVLRHEPFSPSALAQEIGRTLTARAGNKDIKAEISIARDLPAIVSGDALRLRAALENLADNAMKFTERGAVSFSAGAEPAGRSRIRLIFTIADTGIGMSPEEIKKLFRPFAQASEAIARRYGGSGLGLIFVERIVKAMGGKLVVTGRKGVGTTFRIVVPIDRVAAQPSAEQNDSRAGPARSLSILCAEDNPYGRVVMNTIVTELGHRVDFVESGEAAVQAAGRGGYDAVLMDVTLAGLDGVAATRRIRALAGEAGQVPIIGISGRGDRGSEDAARAAGMNFYFSKPVSPGKLAHALATLSAPRVRGEGGEPQ